MKIYIPQLFRQGVFGGGWQFSHTFAKFAKWAEFVDDPMKAEIYFIAGSSQVEDKYEPERAKANGAKIILRIDNALKNSNNRGTGMPRMKKYSGLADLVIYQSQWARDYLKPFTEKDGPVILNGVDQSIFKPPKQRLDNVYLYSRSSRDDQKGWHRAWYEYQMIQRKNPNAQLWIIGKFSKENLEYNFDFFNNENWKYLGVISNQETMAQIYQDASYLLFTAFGDACSNTLIEALESGMRLVPTYELTTGGSPEIMDCKDLSAERMVKEYHEEFYELLQKPAERVSG